MTVIIVDDEPQARRRIERLLMDDPDFQIIGQFGSAVEAGEFLQNSQVDLMFLDIEMPGPSGIKFMGTLPDEIRPQVIFVTAFDDYAVMAFEYFALDYILKPFSNERFFKSIGRVKRQLKISSKPVDWQTLDSFIGNKEVPKDRFVIKIGNKYEFVPFSAVNYILANGSYATLICHDGRKLLYRETIANLSEMLVDFGFTRIHHSAIIFVENVKGLNRLSFGDLEVIMNDGVSIRVSRTYKKELKRMLS